MPAVSTIGSQTGWENKKIGIKRPAGKVGYDGVSSFSNFLKRIFPILLKNSIKKSRIFQQQLILGRRNPNSVCLSGMIS
ncbi:MAG: hypothetical protein ABI688_10365 [Bacteroidota bacterium]